MGISGYLAHLMVSSHVCNASIPKLVKTMHVIDKLLSGESTLLTRGGGGHLVLEWVLIDCCFTARQHKKAISRRT